jgi:ribosomal subunit interface protein
MQIQVNPDDITLTEALNERIENEVQKALKHHTDRVTRVEVTIRDENGPKSGVDKHCMMEARLAGEDPITVEAESDDMYAAVHQSAEKLEKAVGRHLDRKYQHPKR